MAAWFLFGFGSIIGIILMPGLERLAFAHGGDAGLFLFYGLAFGIIFALCILLQERAKLSRRSKRVIFFFVGLVFPLVGILLAILFGVARQVLGNG